MPGLTNCNVVPLGKRSNVFVYIQKPSGKYVLLHYVCFCKFIERNVALSDIQGKLFGMLTMVV